MDVEGWQRFEYRDTEEGTLPTENCVSKDVEIRNYREAANTRSSFLVSRMHEEDEKERAGASDWG